MVGDFPCTYKQKFYLLLCHTNINPIIQISTKMTTELTTPAMIGIGGPADEKLTFSKDPGKYKNML